MLRRIGFAFALVFVCLVSLTHLSSVWAFTQSGGSVAGMGFIIPMGHEWITRLAAIELIGAPAPVRVPDLPDPKDPRKKWTMGLAKNLDISSAGAQAELARIRGHRAAHDFDLYKAHFEAVLAAIVGERWVDIAGYNMFGSVADKSCWDAVAQEPAKIQYDHFMRRYDDREAKGGVDAATSSRQRFVEYFVTAAMAPEDTILVYDGGANGSVQTPVSRNYFLFGRALHLFEDSFSSEHTVRLAADNYVRLRQVKSYMCAAGSEQHDHSNVDVLDYTSGDVVWLQKPTPSSAWSTYLPSDMRGQALAATEGTKDAWAAFIRTMGTPRAQRQDVATREADTLAENWLNFDKEEMLRWYDNEDNRDQTYVLASGQTGKGMTVAACMTGLKVGTDSQDTYEKELESTQRKCLYNAIPRDGYSDAADPQLDIWFDWRWKNGVGAMLNPPDNWTIPHLPANTGRPVRIGSKLGSCFLTTAESYKMANGNYLYCKSNKGPVDFTLVGPASDGMLRVADAPLLFFSYAGSASGSVEILPQPGKSNFNLSRPPGAQPSVWNIQNTYYKQYVWLDGETPRLTKQGDRANNNAQWFIDNLQ